MAGAVRIGSDAVQVWIGPRAESSRDGSFHISLVFRGQAFKIEHFTMSFRPTIHPSVEEVASWLAKLGWSSVFHLGYGAVESHMDSVD